MCHLLVNHLFLFLTLHPVPLHSYLECSPPWRNAYITHNKTFSNFRYYILYMYIYIYISQWECGTIIVVASPQICRLQHMLHWSVRCTNFANYQTFTLINVISTWLLLFLICVLVVLVYYLFTNSYYCTN